MMEQSPDVQDDLGTGGKFKTWLQDNIRIILSVLIVLAIAGGIYSYSKRTATPTGEELAIQQLNEQQSGLSQNNEESAVTIMNGETSEQEVAKPAEEKQQPTPTKQDTKVETPSTAAQTTTSEETGDSFVETAVRGDSKTTLARKSLKDYLEKNTDSSLTSEHKIYIEDYLRRRVDGSGGIQIGTKLTFLKTMIKDSIEKSKTLNERQLQNLKQYSSRVSNL